MEFMSVQPLANSTEPARDAQQESVSRELAEFAAGLDFDAIPQRVRECAKYHMLDVIGTALAATRFDFALHGFPDCSASPRAAAIR